ncbi:unnamed protein product [Rotaria sp. Silwood2]|nr:unnamed protein product [Rotaria sp. Silwood2]
MTRRIRAKISTGTYFELTEWMKQYTAHFGNFYRNALMNLALGEIHNIPRSWLLAFKHAYKGDMTFYINFALGMSAHIGRDLGITLSELDPLGMNATAKKSDSQKVNNIIHNCSLELITALTDFYAPVLNLTNWKTLLYLTLDTFTDVLRGIAWNNAVFIASYPVANKTAIRIMDADAWILGETLVALAPLFRALRQYERSFPFEHFCTVVPWGCADFSGRINLIQKHNSKKDVIWSKDKTTIPAELITVGQQKYCPGVIIFGAISSRGLIPKESPIFIDDWLKTECEKLGKKRHTMDRFLYIKLIEQELKPHIDMIFPEVNVIWQDDADSKHRSSYALNKIDELFYERITPDEEASKMADIWPIENVWGHIKEKLDVYEIRNIAMLRKKLCKFGIQ